MNIKLTEKDKIRILDTDDIFGIMQRILLRNNKIDQEKEHFWIVGLNNAGYIIYVELISLGTATKTLVEPMNVFRVAVLKGVIKVIAVHNHPSGSMKASADDEDVTDRLIQVGKIIDIKVYDHLIISPTTYVSFRQMGLMDKLEESNRYVPHYILAERMLKEKKLLVEKIREAEESKQKVTEAKSIQKEIQNELNETKQKLDKTIHSLLNKNTSLEEISDLLGISIDEVKKISKRKPKI